MADDGEGLRVIMVAFDHAPSDAELFEHGTPDAIAQHSSGERWWVRWTVKGEASVG